MQEESNPIAELKIDKLVYGGHGIAHWEDKAIFVPNVAPHELVLAEIKPRRKGVRWGKLLKIIKPNSQQRVQPVCLHAISCGGCAYQHLSHSAQVQIKEEILREIYNYQFALQPSIVSPREFNYRNKCEFTFGDSEDGEVDLGLHPKGKFFEVLDLKECHLLPAEMWQVLQAVKKLVRASGLKAYRDLKEEGFWATITLRQSSSSGEVLLIWKVKDPHEPKLKQISAELKKQFPFIVGVLAKQAPRGSSRLLFGRDTISQKVGPIDLVYGADNFFQINTFVLPLFMERITELLVSVKPDVVYDLFGGVGAIGIYIAKVLLQIKTVIGAEADELACKMAEFNSELNGLNNYRSNFLNLYKGGWGKFLKVQKQNVCVIVDPPRAGMTPKTIKDILELAPQSLIYVSCNPTTQKRDLESFIEAGYRMQSLQLVDMFPQTMHLESIAFLQNTV
jgi:23S rRNA (uracil1939-C5)-methyltransferase